MKLGGLFSGVGGFELAWTQLGHEVAWMCEWDKNAQKVLEARFPGVPIYPDVRDLDPAEVEAVDVLTGGSPCQGFSIAGTRSGLEHSESQLFADYVRIMDGLAARGLQYAVWENVPGVLSIRNDDGERTFAHVIGALVGAGEPVRLDPKRKWNVGLAANAGRAVAWRVLDSRYFGVAQRRRRVFACVAFGDSAANRAGRALLAVSESVLRDSSSGVEAGEGAAGGVGGGVAGASGVAHTLTGNGFDASEDGTGRGTPIVPQWWNGENTSDTLTTKSDVQRMPDKGRLQAVIDAPITVRKLSSRQWVEDEIGGTLAARDYKDSGDLVVEQPAVLLTMRAGKPGGGKGALLAEEQSLTLATGNGQTLFQPQAFRKARRAQSSADHETWVADGQANTLNVFDVGDTRTTHAIVEPPAYGVRRLTPVECERLQSFPDRWTEPAVSDSARYKAMGNAVTVNVVRWILGRLP